MKKILLTVLLVAGFTGSIFAQYDPKALEILDKVSQKFEKMNGFKADFIYTLNNEAVGTNAETKGEIVAKGKKFKLNMNGQEIISDGVTVWTFQPETNEVYIDKFENVVGEENVNPSNIHNLYRKGYKYVYREEKMIKGKPHHVIDLVPEKASENNFFKIQLVINKQDLTFDSFTIFEKSGNRYSFDIRNFNPGVTLEDKSFVFSKKSNPNVVEVDMRGY